jgi:hypothetical protein
MMKKVLKNLCGYFFGPSVSLFKNKLFVKPLSVFVVMLANTCRTICLLLILIYVISLDKKEVILKDGSVVHGQRTVIGHKKKAIFFVDGQGTRHAFPDFYTFSKLGFNVEEVRKMDDERVDAMPLGKAVTNYCITY